MKKLMPSAGPIARRIELAVCLLLLAHATIRAEGPPWWTNRNVLISDAVTNDYAAINMGQLKQLATNAYAELELLPTGAGTTLPALLDDWLPDGTNYCAVNVGQLKHVASLVYDRLIVANYTNAYPWTADSGVSDFSAAAIGQAKHLFSFDISSDTDGDGLPDWWETRYGLDCNDPNDANDDEDDDLSSNLQEYHACTNPSDPVDGMVFRESARQKIIAHWPFIYPTPLLFANEPGSAEDIQDLRNACVALSGKFYRPVSGAD